MPFGKSPIEMYEERSIIEETMSEGAPKPPPEGVAPHGAPPISGLRQSFNRLRQKVLEGLNKWQQHAVIDHMHQLGHPATGEAARDTLDTASEQTTGKPVTKPPGK